MFLIFVKDVGEVYKGQQTNLSIYPANSKVQCLLIGLSLTLKSFWTNLQQQWTQRNTHIIKPY